MGKVFEYFKDFAVVSALLTVLSYFLSYSFDKGISDFYGIGDISFAEVGLPSIINTLQALSPLVLVFGLLLLFSNFILLVIRPIFSWISRLFMRIVYFVILGPINFVYKFASKKVPEYELQIEKKFRTKYKIKLDYAKNEWSIAQKDIFEFEVEEDLKNKVSMIYTYAISGTIFLLYIPRLTLGITAKEFPELWLVSGLLLVVIPLFVTGGLVIFQKIRATQLRGTANGENSSVPISLKILNIWTKSKWLIKVIILFLIIVVASKMFYQYGYTTAENKKEYMTMVHNGTKLVVLEKGKELLITAEIKEGDKNPKLNGEYKLIELKPNNEKKELALVNETFPDGIQVAENKRKKFLEKINSWFK